MTTVKSRFLVILELLLCKICFQFISFGSDFVKQLFRIQIQKGGKVLLWNQVNSRMEACYSELILVEMVCSTMFACALSLFAKQLTLISLLFLAIYRNTVSIDWLCLVFSVSTVFLQ